MHQIFVQDLPYFVIKLKNCVCSPRSSAHVSVIICIFPLGRAGCAGGGEGRVVLGDLVGSGPGVRVSGRLLCD